MKKLFIALLALPAILFAQESNEKTIVKLKKERTVSLGLCASSPSSFSVNFESNDDEKTFGYNTSSIFEIGLTATSLEAETGFGTKEVFIGSGHLLKLASRVYFDKSKNNGFYFQNGFEYGQVKFSESFYVFSGKYSYWSLVNPEIGWKFKMWKHITVDPSVGFLWKWELRKNQGNIDNTMFENFVPKIGLKIGYAF